MENLLTLGRATPLGLSRGRETSRPKRNEGRCGRIQFNQVCQAIRRHTNQAGAATDRGERTCSLASSRVRSTPSGTTSGPAASPTLSRSWSSSPTCSSSRGSTSRRPSRSARPTAPGARSSARSSRKGRHPGRARSALRGPALDAASRTSSRARCTTSSRTRLPVPAGTRRTSTHGKHMRARGSRSRRRRCCRRPSTGSTTIPMEDRDTKGDVYEYMLSQDRHRRPERPVPHAAPHHPAHGRDDRAHTDRHDLRPGLRHLRLPRRRRRVPPRAPSRIAHRPEAEPSISTTRCSTASTSTTRCCASAR